MITQIEINLTHLADTEQVVLKDAKVADIKSVIGGSLFGSWIGKESISAEVCITQRDTKNLRVQLHIYNDRYCKGAQLLLTQNGDDICGKIEWAKGTKRRADRNEKIEKILQSDWNDTYNADVANLDTNIPIGKMGYGVEIIIVEVEQPEEASKEEDNVHEVAKPQEAKATETVENKSKKNEQMPVTLARWRGENEMYGSGLSIQFPKNMDLWNMDELSIKNFLVGEIENAAHNIKGDDIVDHLSPFFGKGEVRAIRNIGKLTENAKISKGKMIFTYYVEKYIKRDAILEERFVGEECNSLCKNPSYSTPYDAPYIKDADEAYKDLEAIMNESDRKFESSHYSGRDIYQYQIFKGSGKVCVECRGEKKERCPNCQGSGREQYVDSYFANREPKYKTGRCGRCYGTGQITCRHCEGTGLEDKGTGMFATAKKYKQYNIYKKYFGYITPWFFIAKDNKTIEACWFGKKFIDLRNQVKNHLSAIHKNQNEVIYDKNIEIREDILSKIGYEYGDMYDALQKKIKDLHKEDDGKIAWEAQCFLTTAVYKIDYVAEERKYSICVFVDENNSAFVDWNGIPKMGLFGGIKKN